VNVGGRFLARERGAFSFLRAQQAERPRAAQPGAHTGPLTPLSKPDAIEFTALVYDARLHGARVPGVEVRRPSCGEIQGAGRSAGIGISSGL
jgi:hypothetical protein